MKKLDAKFWDIRYFEHNTGWDVGHPTTPFIEFTKTLTDKNISILIPGCGHAYEAEMLHNHGFKNITLLDYSNHAREDFLKRVPKFNPEHYLIGDFFKHSGNYDLILEQTFFCALKPQLRQAYAEKMFNLLNQGGRLVGVLFKFPLTEQGPPFGGNKEEYLGYFAKIFDINKLEDCRNSIKPRIGNELFINLQKPNKDY